MGMGARGNGNAKPGLGNGNEPLGMGGNGIEKVIPAHFYFRSRDKDGCHAIGSAILKTLWHTHMPTLSVNDRGTCKMRDVGKVGKSCGGKLRGAL